MTQPPPDLAPPHRLVLVRHGQTDHTVRRLISGSRFRPEPGLDADGAAQAVAAGRRLADLGPIDEVVTSPMLRARQTTDLIVGQLGGATVAQSEDWAEADFGQWEGLDVAEVMRRFPGAWETMMADPALGPPGGESLDAVRERIAAAWAGAVRPGRTTLVVTHLTPIRIVVAQALATPHHAFARVLALPGSITVVDRWSDGGCAVITLGERPTAGPGL